MPSLARSCPEERVDDEGVHGGHDGVYKIPLARIGETLRGLLSGAEPVVIVKAATGSGKSKWLPSFVARGTRGRILVVTPATHDVRDMYDQANGRFTGSLGWRTGKGKG